MTSTLLTLAILLPAAPAPVRKAARPTGLPPRIVMIVASSDGKFEMMRTRQALVMRKVQKQVLVGKEVRTVTETIKESAPIQQSYTTSLDGEGVQLYRDGKKIDVKDVRKLAAKPIAALLSEDGKPVDPFYLQLAREGTLVIVIPVATQPAGIAIPAPARKR